MKITQPVLLLSTSLASALLLLTSTSHVHASPIGHPKNPATAATTARRRETAPPPFGSLSLFADDSVPHADQLAQQRPRYTNKYGGNSNQRTKSKKSPSVAASRRLAKRTNDDSDDYPAVGSSSVASSRQQQDTAIPLTAVQRRRRHDYLVQDAEDAEAAGASWSSSLLSANTPSKLKKRALSPGGDLSSLEPKGTNEDTASTEATHGSAPRVAEQVPSSNPPSSSSSSTSNNASLILLPNPKTVWHAGSTQTVKWSRKYAKQLPADTTVDIVLVDARTNRKLHSLKRFIPFAKGSASVWVPTQIQEGISYVLVLELYRGRSQDQVSVESRIASSPSAGDAPLSSSSSPPSSDAGVGAGVGTGTKTTSAVEQHDSAPTTSQDKKQLPTTKSSPSSSQHQSSSSEKRTILRRSEINIAHRSRKVPRGNPWSSSSDTRNNDSANRQSYPNQRQQQQQAPPHASNGDRDVHSPSSSAWDHKDRHPYEFMPEEMRREFPGIDPPLDIEHTFGTHQIVVTKSPYTISWKVPQRVADWLEKAELMLQAWNAAHPNAFNSQSDHGIQSARASIQAKVRVDVVKDQTLEVVSTLARNVPAQTMFMYLQVDDRLPIANYRLRVQMLVVEVMPSKSSSDTNNVLLPDERPPEDEGWDFPPNSRIIDRYETITRRFQVVAGAL
ncbi:hypothetical protein BGW41_007382 [Actinomortierella wolfii]|nr:hypothetical protein BGW41_007382 [Actinomortierella wolfii]